ncbi:MAG TPA: hypothetical protein PLK99_09450, partial [Burkholderiales bacterium]|nr:hypothetical protein [Burkholderiales bacterium]
MTQAAFAGERLPRVIALGSMGQLFTVIASDPETMRNKFIQIALLQVGLILSPICPADDPFAIDEPYVFGQGMRLGNY